MIVICDRVWEAWREATAELGEWSLQLVVRSAVPVGELAEAVRGAVGVAVLEFDAAHPEVDGVDDAASGWWGVTESPAGVMVRVDEEPDEFEWMLHRIAAGLEAAGVSGEFDVAESVVPAPDVAEVMDPHARIDLLECRIRVRGTAGEWQGFPYRLVADRAAFAAVGEAAVAWCCESPSRLPPWLEVGMTSVALGAGDDVLEAVRAGVRATESLGVVQLWAVGPGRFRAVGLAFGHSRITLVEGGDALAGGAWQAPLDALRALLTDTGEWAAHAYIKRGRKPIQTVVFDDSLDHDWVGPVRFPLNTLVGEAYELRYAPDAFGVQVLGPGYADRLPTQPDWHTTPLRGGAYLVEHLDPAAWYAEMFQTPDPLVPPQRRESPPIPDVVTRARHDLAPIILTEQIAYPDRAKRTT